MKKAISFLSLLLMAIIAFAEPHFVSLSNKAKHVDAQFGDTTTVIVKFKKLSKLENSRLKFCINGEDKYIDIPTDMN